MFSIEPGGAILIADVPHLYCVPTLSLCEPVMYDTAPLASFRYRHAVNCQAVFHVTLWSRSVFRTRSSPTPGWRSEPPSSTNVFE